MTGVYTHVPHPWHEQRRQQGPVKVQDQIRSASRFRWLNWYARANAKIAVWVTVGVGSMTCAWLFAGLAIAGLPTAMKPGNIGLLFWISSDFLQLTLLSIIIVGQNILAVASNKRADQTFRDAEAVLHEALQIQAHLAAQDTILERLLLAAGLIDPARPPAAGPTEAAPAAPDPRRPPGMIPP